MVPTMATTVIPDIDQLEAAAEAVSVPLFPYDRATMTRTVEVPLDSDRTKYRTVARPVTDDFDVAIFDPRFDFWHKGGEIVGKSGKFYGSHPAGWFGKGHKWYAGRPEFEQGSDF